MNENGIEQVDELENRNLHQHQEIDHNEHENGTPKVETVELISRDNKCLLMPRMKTETTTASAAAAESQLHSDNRMQNSIDEEEMETAAEQQASSQHWRPPHLLKVL
jgi:hypothetical protein